VLFFHVWDVIANSLISKHRVGQLHA